MMLRGDLRNVWEGAAPRDLPEEFICVHDVALNFRELFAGQGSAGYAQSFQFAVAEESARLVARIFEGEVGDILQSLKTTLFQNGRFIALLDEAEEVVELG